MATGYSQVLTTDLDVVTTYKELMEASIGQGSVYLKAKETLTEIYANSNLTDPDKASVVAQTVSQIAIGITTQAMNAAIELAKDKRDSKYTLTKMKEDTRLVTANISKLEADIDNMGADKDNKILAGWKAQGELYRDYGVHTWDYTLLPTVLPIAAYDTYGTKVETIKMSQANVYNGYSTAYRQNGTVLPIIDGNGWLTTGTVGDATGLSYWQTKVAERQEQGFDDNTRQHVANSSATMVSMLLSSEEAALVDDASVALAKWTTAVDYLNSPSDRPAGAISLTSDPILSKSTGFSINGAATALAGFGLVIKLVKVSGNTSSPYSIDAAASLVLLDGTWSATIPSTKLIGTSVNDVYNLTISTIDQRGDTVSTVKQETIVA